MPSTKIPLAVKVGRMHEHETHWTRALVARRGPIWPARPACTKSSLIGAFWMGPICGGWTSRGSRFVVPAKTNMAVTADARAQAAAGEEITRARRVHTVRHGQGKTARTERIETEVVGIRG